jgi:hypothetical protein
MDMLVDPTDLYWSDVIVPRNAAQVFPDAIFNGLTNPLFAVLGRENNLIVERRVGVYHDYLLLSRASAETAILGIGSSVNPCVADATRKPCAGSLSRG